jgi:hypothetical protein
MSPLQFVTRQRITRAQQLIRETSRSLNRGRDRSRLHQPKPFRAGSSDGKPALRRAITGGSVEKGI